MFFEFNSEAAARAVEIRGAWPWMKVQHGATWCNNMSRIGMYRCFSYSEDHVFSVRFLYIEDKGQIAFLELVRIGYQAKMRLSLR